MDVNEIRAKYWKLKSKIDTLGPTADRELMVSIMEMLTELTAQVAEINVTLGRTVGLVNFEELALRLTVALEKVEKEKKPPKVKPQ